MPFTSVAAPRQFDAMPRLASDVRFEQAPEAAQSVQWKPPVAAFGSSGSDSARIRCMENCLAEVNGPHRSFAVMRIKFILFLLLWSRWEAAAVSTGPAGTQRLPCRRVGSGVGAEYAPKPFTAHSQAWHARKLQGRNIAQLIRAARQHATNPAKAPLRAARSNPSLKRSANGRPPAPGRWYAVHFHRPGAGVLPLSPA